MNTHPQMPPAVERWQRIGLGIRLAYNPNKPGVIACYLGLGRHLTQQGLLDAVGAQRRMLRVLMQCALDEALPWRWRHACLEFAVHPLARLRREADAAQLDAAWQAAQQALPDASARI